jgi:hypothetical protein
LLIFEKSDNYSIDYNDSVNQKLVDDSSDVQLKKT